MGRRHGGWPKKVPRPKAARLSTAEPLRPRGAGEERLSDAEPIAQRRCRALAAVFDWKHCPILMRIR